MKSNTASHFTAFLPLAFIASFGLAGDSSLNNTNTESPEETAIVALEQLRAQNHSLKAEVEDAKSAAANATQEAEIFRRQIKSLSERMEILGGNATDPAKLEQRLLQAVHELQISDKSRETLTARIDRLARCCTEYLKNPDKETKTVMETELNNVNQMLLKMNLGTPAEMPGKPNQTGPDLMNAKVSAVKPDLGCIIINVGAEQGVKIGAPFQVRRRDKIVGTIRVVDVRRAFAGSVIQNLVSAKDPIQLGDTIQMDAHLN
jgi:FtsZ-binding cell division protein ZapB